LIQGIIPHCLLKHRWFRMVSTLCRDCISRRFSKTRKSQPKSYTWVANRVPEKNLFFQFSKEIKKFPSSSPRPWCQTVLVSAKLLQTLSRISINLSYGSSAFPS
jgi:hypothetical protein